ncbi:unnamed protein product, partial [marine sediment metagenome]
SASTPVTADSNVTITTAAQTIDATKVLALTTLYIPDGIGVSAT